MAAFGKPHLDPRVASPSDGVRRPEPLGDHPFQAEPANGLGDLIGRPGQRVREENARTLDDAPECRTTIDQGRRREVAPVKMQEIERVIDDRESPGRSVMKGLEGWMPISVQRDDLAVEDGGGRLQPRG